MDFFAQTYKDAQGFDYPPVHDPCAVAYVIDPTVMTTRKVPVDIELQGKLTLGMTVADFRAPAPADCHTSVAVDLDRTKFWNLVTDALVRIGEVDLGTAATTTTTAAPASASPETSGEAAK
jgi:purine nucleosidase